MQYSLEQYRLRSEMHSGFHPEISKGMKMWIKMNEDFLEIMRIF